jgi:RNase H-fold protein (predicted Holliday junction resolvase)
LKAQDFLRQVRKLDLQITNKLIEQQQWKDIALGITANMDGERVQSSGSKSKMANAVEKCVDMETEIDSLIDKLIDTKKEVIQTIERLDSPTEYDVLHRRYIQFLSLQEIADHYRKDYGWATTTHGRALKSLQEILDSQ